MKQDVQGKLVIISIFGVAIAMSIYAWSVSYTHLTLPTKA